MSHKVTAAYATLRVPNALGQEVLQGFYQGAVVPANANREDVKRHVRKGMIQEVSAPAPAPEPEPVLTDEQWSGVEAEAEESPSRPPQNAPKAEWVTYAESQGFSHNEADAMSKADLIATFGG